MATAWAKIVVPRTFWRYKPSCCEAKVSIRLGRGWSPSEDRGEPGVLGQELKQLIAMTAGPTRNSERCARHMP